MSGDPPIATRPRATSKDAGANIRATGRFVVDVVNADNAEAVNQTACGHASGVDGIQRASLTTLPSTHVRSPCVAALECEHLHTTGIGPERTIVLGRVHAAAWYSRTTDRFELERVEEPG